MTGSGAPASVWTESIAELLLARSDDDHVGLRTREQAWTWAEVVRESARRAAIASARRGAGPFHIGVLLDNIPEFIFWLGGAALAGATVVGLNPTRRGEELTEQVNFTECQLVITDPRGLELLDGLDLDLPPQSIIDVASDAWTDELARVVESNITADLAPETLMLLLFTSGTTGQPKAVKCSQGRLADIGRSHAAKYGLGRDDVCYCAMPLFHGNALMTLWAPALATGATIALAPKFSAARFLDDVRHHQATYFTYVGRAIAYLLDTPKRPDDCDNPLIRAFGTEASPEDQAAFRGRFGAELCEGYGSSEGGNHTRQDPAAPPSAIGRPLPGVRIVNTTSMAECAPAVLDDHGRVTNPDEAIGEIVNTETAHRFEGYWRNEEADAERVRHGWFWTGDLGYIDTNGFLYFAGRAGDWIRVDGENISARLIEQVLRRHACVVLAGVYGVPDPRSGDQVMAALEVADPESFDVVEFADFLSGQDDLGVKGVPRLLRLSKQLPTTGSNKVLKRRLQAEAWACDEPVYRWAGRQGPVYGPLTASARQALVEEFAAAGRRRFLPESLSPTVV
jgi:fatty-acyl-CoA synthase